MAWGLGLVWATDVVSVTCWWVSPSCLLLPVLWFSVVLGGCLGRVWAIDVFFSNVLGSFFQLFLAASALVFRCSWGWLGVDVDHRCFQ